MKLSVSSLRTGSVNYEPSFPCATSSNMLETAKKQRPRCFFVPFPASACDLSPFKTLVSHVHAFYQRQTHRPQCTNGRGPAQLRTTLRTRSRSLTRVEIKLQTHFNSRRSLTDLAPTTATSSSSLWVPKKGSSPSTRISSAVICVLRGRVCTRLA